jgi:glycosyltransferase involved in cell wall biosynthesis
MMGIDLAFVTYNRLEYTKLALASILADPSEEFSLTIWDNASTDGTVEYLKEMISDPRVKDIIFSKENVGQIAAVNAIWSNSQADLIGKLDNDCLMTPGWTRILAAAHRDIKELGAIACWHYAMDDFEYERAKHKIQVFGNHQILRHPWTCGAGVILKRETFVRLGPMKGWDTTSYWLRMAQKGYINGFYYPLVLQEHMDDPKSKHCLLKDDATIEKMREITCVLRYHNIRTMADRWTRREMILHNLLDEPWDVKYYTGWRGMIRKVRSRSGRFVARA